jgi:transposase
VEAGHTVKEVALGLGVTEATIYTWQSKYGGRRSAKRGG